MEMADNGDGGKGVIAAGHPLTVQAGAQIMREGGNAFDGAIAALAMAFVCEPVLASPGGGGFAMIRGADDSVPRLLDFFPHTPLQRRQPGSSGSQEISANFGPATQVFHIGPATAATPGMIAGMHALHKAGATIPLADLMAPAIAAATRGVAMSPFQAYLAEVVSPILTATRQARALFAPGGHLIAANETFRNAGLAELFSSLAAAPDKFTGLEDAIIEAQRKNGNLTRKDLARYRVVERQPLEIRHGDAKIWLNPPPAASGTIIGKALAPDFAGDAFGLAQMTADADRIRQERYSRHSGNEVPPLRQKGTTHISVLDKAGNACAVTVSNGEGNGHIVGNYGFMLNNILGEEDVNPGLAQAWPADCRLASMMCPALLRFSDGRLIALGSGGSNRIRSALLQVIARLCAGQSSIDKAVLAPRLHIEDGRLDIESQFGDAMVAQLCRRYANHCIWPEPNMFFGGVHVAAFSPEHGFAGFGDPRRAGAAEIV